MKISLYKGGLHKIIGVPRRWALSKPSINLPLFKKALEKRAEALLLTAKGNSVEVCPALEPACLHFLGKENECEGKPQAVLEPREDASESSRKRKRLHAKGTDESAPAKQVCIEKSASEDLTRADAANSQQAQAAEAPAELQEMAIEKNPETVSDVEHKENKLSAESKPISEEQAKRKAELEDKLKTLTSEKHRLVQLLKQILSSEEETKRRGQGLLQSPPTPAPPAPITAPPPCFSISKLAISDPPPAAPAAPLLAAAAEMGVRPMDLEEGELDYARTPSPRPRMLLAAGNHSLGSRQTHISTQGGMSRLGYHSSSSNNSSSGGGYTHSSSHAKGGRIVKWES